MSIAYKDLYKKACEFMPEGTIKPHNTWVGVILHGVDSVNEIKSLADILWVKCHDRITIRTLKHEYFSRHPLEKFEFKFDRSFVEETFQVKDLRKESPYNSNIVILRAFEEDDIDAEEALEEEIEKSKSTNSQNHVETGDLNKAKSTSNDSENKDDHDSDSDSNDSSDEIRGGTKKSAHTQTAISPKLDGLDPFARDTIVKTKAMCDEAEERQRQYDEISAKLAGIEGVELSPRSVAILKRKFEDHTDLSDEDRPDLPSSTNAVEDFASVDTAPSTERIHEPTNQASTSMEPEVSSNQVQEPPTEGDNHDATFSVQDVEGGGDAPAPIGGDPGPNHCTCPENLLALDSLIKEVRGRVDMSLAGMDGSDDLFFQDWRLFTVRLSELPPPHNRMDVDDMQPCDACGDYFFVKYYTLFGPHSRPLCYPCTIECVFGEDLEYFLKFAALEFLEKLYKDDRGQDQNLHPCARVNHPNDDPTPRLTEANLYLSVNYRLKLRADFTWNVPGCRENDEFLPYPEREENQSHQLGETNNDGEKYNSLIPSSHHPIKPFSFSFRK